MRQAFEAHARGRGARITVVRHQVLQAERDRVHAERFGGEIDEPFCDGRRDGVADGAVLAGRRLVLQHDRRLGAVVRKIIRPAEQVDDLIAFDGAGARINGIRADARQIIGIDREDLAIGIDRHACCDAVIARVDIAGEALQPVGDELRRAAEQFGDQNGCDLIRIDVHLDAVAAADVRADDAHVLLRQPQMLGEHALHHVRRLRRVMHDQLSRGAIVVGQDRARLERDAGMTAGVIRRLDDFVRSS